MANSIITDIPGFLALFLEISERLGKSSPPMAAFTEVVKQRMPHMFGIGREDEQLYEAIRQMLEPAEQHLVDLVTGKMKDYEETIFCITVTGMPCGNELDDDLLKNPKGAPTVTKKVVTWDMTVKDLRVKYLKGIASEVSRHIANGCTESNAATLVVKDMRARRLITRSPSAQKAHELWAKTVKWVEKDFLQLFDPDVKEISDITPVMIAEKINSLAEKIPERSDAELNTGWWCWMYENHPVITFVVIALIALAIAGTFTPPPIH